MRIPDKKYIGAMFAGFLWGAAITSIFGIIYLRNNSVLEYRSKYGFDETVKKALTNVRSKKPWQAQLVSCALPQTSDKCRMRIIKLCHGQYAKQMLESPDDRKVAAIIPCAFAIYEKPDGKTYISRQNVSLTGRLLGGIPGRLFPAYISKDQNFMLESIIEK